MDIENIPCKVEPFAPAKIISSKLGSVCKSEPKRYDASTDMHIEELADESEDNPEEFDLPTDVELAVDSVHGNLSPGMDVGRTCKAEPTGSDTPTEMHVQTVYKVEPAEFGILTSVELDEELAQEELYQGSDSSSSSSQVVELLVGFPVIDAQFVPPKNYKFPKRTFGVAKKKKKSCSHIWFERFRWLHYSEHDDTVVCFLCYRAYIHGFKESDGKENEAFLKGFHNWNDGGRMMEKHEMSSSHQKAVTFLKKERSDDLAEILSNSPPDSEIIDFPVIDTQFVPAKNYQFPKRVFGVAKKKKRSCSHVWFERFHWLHYNEHDDTVVCFACYQADIHNLERSDKRQKDAFLKGFHDWNDGGRKLEKHEMSCSHQEALEAFNKKKSAELMDELQSAKCEQSKLDNHDMLSYVIGALRFLSRQGVAIRGSSNTLSCDSPDPDGNFLQLLQLIGKTSKKAADLIARSERFVSLEVQNELLEIMFSMITHQLKNKICGAEWYSLMIDETSDADQGQAIVSFRIVEDLMSYEYPIGLIELPGTTAEDLFFAVKDILCHFNIPMELCRGHHYESKVPVKGKRSKLKSLIQKENPKACYVHRYAHSLQLAVQDSVRANTLIADVLDLCSCVAKLIRNSPKQTAELSRITQAIGETSFGFRTICLTRWAIREKAVSGILQNYKCLLQIFADTAEINDPDIKFQTIGTYHMLNDRNMFFGLKLAMKLFTVVDSFNTSLQGDSLTSSNGHEMAQAVLETLTKLHNDEQFTLFYDDVMKAGDSLGLREKTAQKRKLPAINVCNNKGRHDTSSKDKLRKEYFSIVAAVIETIGERFGQDSHDIYGALISLISQAIKGDAVTIDPAVKETCSGDFHFEQLEQQLSEVSSLVDQEKVTTVRQFATWIRRSPNRSSLNQVEKLVKLVLTLPATDALSERSSSVLKRIKNYLSNSAGQERFNSSMILHIYEYLTDDLDVELVIQNFVQGHAERERRIAFNAG